VTRLAITADDFGLACEVNEAVEIAVREGVLTSTSLMVRGAAAEDAVRRARKLPQLRVGLHLVLVDGFPALSPTEIPDLVDQTGRLRRNMVRLSFALAARPGLRNQMRREIEAQFEAYRRTGLPLDHVDVHKHFHLHPIVAREIIAVGRRFGMRALRVPMEPGEIVFNAAPETPGRHSHRLLQSWAARLQAQVRRLGLDAPDQVFGLAWTGVIDCDRLTRLLPLLSCNTAEIYTHPATSDRFAESTEGYGYVRELEALCSPAVKAAACRYQLASYACA
jgi:hopanoid biosynthesis associated protein HpnK